MATTQETSRVGHVLDILKLLAAAGVLVGGLYGYYYYLEWSLPLRVLLVLGGLAAGIVIAMTSVQGHRLWAFHSGVASRNSQSYLANEAGNHADGNCCFRIYINYGVVLLGSGLVPALADTHAGRICRLNTDGFKGKIRWRYAGTSSMPIPILSIR